MYSIIDPTRNFCGIYRSPGKPPGASRKSEGGTLPDLEAKGGIARAAAHSEPKTPAEVERLRALQAAAYHVRGILLLRGYLLTGDRPSVRAGGRAVHVGEAEGVGAAAPVRRRHAVAWVCRPVRSVY